MREDAADRGGRAMTPEPALAGLPPLDMPEGTMDPLSYFYIERPSDRIALDTIERQGVTITIKGPRQMGKSSLLLRVSQKARDYCKRVALLDFQLFDKAALEQPDLFFRQFCDWLTDELELASRVEEYFGVPLGNSQRCTRYIQRYLLKEVGGPLTLAMDEVETIFDTAFRSDFFGMLRSWHNSRLTNSLWKGLDLVLVTSTEPYQLIENLNQSPFNVGEVIELVDFSLEQVAELNRRHGEPLSAAQVQQLLELVGGQPYLVRKALYQVASGRLEAARLFTTATEDYGPFGDHLRNQLFRLHDKPVLLEGLRQVIYHHNCPDERIFFRLRGAGLVRREGRAVRPRNRLYADYFQVKFLEAEPVSNLQNIARKSGEAAGERPATAGTPLNLPEAEQSPKLTGQSNLHYEHRHESLSTRELEVLRLVAAGLSNNQIAERLVLSAHTVNRHLTSVYSKLAVGSRTEAIRYALDHRLL